MQCIITNITLIMFGDLISHLTWKNKQIKSKESDIRTHGSILICSVRLIS